MTFETAHANRAAYEAGRVVRRYAAHSRLQPPEQVVLDTLAPRLGDMRMLDLGVGAGRTTLHFAHRVARYVGVDYSRNMVRACERRFPDAGPAVSFVTCDARRLDAFETAAFDFVLFSFNGLDHIDHDGRIQALREIHRVLAPGGVFLFSAHNLLSVPRLFAFPWRDVLKRPWLIAPKLLRWLLLRRLNRPLRTLTQAACVTINDGAHGFRLKTHYIRPDEQLRQLSATGFTDTRILTLDGQEVPPNADLDQLDDFWLYYECSKLR
ncbi:MAG: methyltransferase domain-containing protein [Verrucomicrobia bacterium]|nr:methyltransferase domain-containing protein [Verrucomicrobiota bacterium]